MLRTLLSLPCSAACSMVKHKWSNSPSPASTKGDPVSLDSVFVVSLSQAGDTMLFYPDTVLVLGTTGIAAGTRPIATASRLAPATPIRTVTTRT
ncbi:MAG: hypothetical protein IPO56_16970 [Flavobacteriales bacterium]|nr:hypothetical protein [Flavobacteriales bacterium]